MRDLTEARWWTIGGRRYRAMCSCGKPPQPGETSLVKVEGGRYDGEVVAVHCCVAISGST